MTLIITELSEFGIVMAGDSAITLSGVTPIKAFGDRAFFGLKKVIPVYKINAGIAYWGWTKMPPHCDEVPWFDEWLESYLFLNQHKYSSIHELAALLESELQNKVNPMTDAELELLPLGNGGLHLAGYTEYQGKAQPCLYHIHNGRSDTHPESDSHIVNANFDIPPNKFLENIGRGNPYLRNGDIEVFARFFDGYFQQFLQEVRRDMQITLPIIALRDDFWRSQIKFISSLYELAGEFTDRGLPRRMVRSIGGDVTTLMIHANMLGRYETR